MAKHQGKIYLGYEDETICEKHQILQNYTTNKIGGQPDWPPLENIQFSFKCPLCGLNRLLVVQCYVPLANSVYHRTLYVFACINPNCWIQSESWLCVRSQFQENSSTVSSTTVATPSPNINLSWCNTADEWDENDNDAANGNFMSVDNAPSPNGVMQRNSDEDEESTSVELEAVEQALGDLRVYDAHNANTTPPQGAVGATAAPAAAAVLEGADEPGLVTVDAPAAPAADLGALLHQTAVLPLELRSRLISGQLQFVSKFMYVEEEWTAPPTDDDTVAELLNKYKKCNEIEVCVGERAGGAPDEEPYEAAAPLHGDRLFHAFLARLRRSPGQILRYSREEPPALGAPLTGAPGACARCGSRLLCELQLVPRLTEALRLPPDTALAHLHFLSVLVFTCAHSCWLPTDTLIREPVLFQPEVV